jgi:hypothetical protein
MTSEREKTLIEVLWDRHFQRVSTSYHRNMASTFKRMLADELCVGQTRRKVVTSIHAHRELERKFPGQVEAAFCEAFPSHQPLR